MKIIEGAIGYRGTCIAPWQHTMSGGGVRAVGPHAADNDVVELAALARIDCWTSRTHRAGYGGGGRSQVHAKPIQPLPTKARLRWVVIGFHRSLVQHPRRPVHPTGAQVQRALGQDLDVEGCGEARLQLMDLRLVKAQRRHRRCRRRPTGSNRIPQIPPPRRLSSIGQTGMA